MKQQSTNGMITSLYKQSIRMQAIVNVSDSESSKVFDIFCKAGLH